MVKKDNRSAQQIIETLLLFAAVIVVLLYFLGNHGPFRGATRTIINKAVNTIYPNN